MSMPNDCMVCDKKVLSHSCSMQCHLCKGIYHINCLYLISKTDSVYINRDRNDWSCPECNSNIFPFNHYDNDNDYYQALSDINYHNFASEYEWLNEIIFTPFEL